MRRVSRGRGHPARTGDSESGDDLSRCRPLGPRLLDGSRMPRRSQPRHLPSIVFPAAPGRGASRWPARGLRWRSRPRLATASRSATPRRRTWSARAGPPPRMRDTDLELRGDLRARLVDQLRETFPLAAALDPQCERELDRSRGGDPRPARAPARAAVILGDEPARGIATWRSSVPNSVDEPHTARQRPAGTNQSCIAMRDRGYSPSKPRFSRRSPHRRLTSGLPLVAFVTIIRRRPTGGIRQIRGLE